MTDYRINAVETERAATGTHEHISGVRVSSSGSATDGFRLSRTTVVNDVRRGGDTYYTAAGGVRADVTVVTCPRCIFPDYLRTKRDYLEADNLLALPRLPKAA